MRKKNEEMIGISLSECNTYISFDLETTGYNSKTCEITEIAAIKVKNNKVIDTFQTLIKPISPIPKAVENLTGITNKMVAGAPSPNDIIPKVLNFMGDNLLIGHNISSYDLHILNRFSKCVTGNSISNFYIDTLHLARKLFPEYPSSLELFSRYCNIEIDTIHRAFADAKLGHECLLYMKNVFPNYFVTPKQFIPMSERPTNKNNFHIAHADSVFPESLSFYSERIDTLEGKTLCLTGAFEYGDRAHIEQLIKKNGGFCRGSVTGKTDYLVVGAASASYSTKVKTALKLQAQGKKVLIIKEVDLFTALLQEENYVK